MKTPIEFKSKSELILEYANSNFENCTYHYTDDKRVTNFKEIKNAFAAGHEAAQPKWISVEDELPEIGFDNQVLVYGKLEYEETMEVFQGWMEKSGFCSTHLREDEDLEVTHWMPLPSPPKTTDNDNP